MSPKKVIHANDKTVEKHLNEGVQLLRLMEKSNYTTVYADILMRYGVAIPYHTLCNRFLGITRPYKQAHASQQLLAPEAEHILVDWIHFYSDTSHPLSRRTICKKAKCICSKQLAWWSQSQSHWQVQAFRSIYWLEIFFFCFPLIFWLCLLVLTCATRVHLWDLSTLAVIWALFSYKYITKSKFYQISLSSTK